MEHLDTTSGKVVTSRVAKENHKKEVKTQVDDTIKSMESTKMSQIVAEQPRISQGQQHFNETITSLTPVLKKLYLSSTG